MGKADPWHYARKDVAQRTFALFEKRLANALVLFGPRRMGKTEFLLRDLGPMAEKAGHRVVYVSFWQASLSPAATLVAGLNEGLKQGGLTAQLARIGEGASPRLKLGASMAGVTAETEIDLGNLRGPPPDDVLLLIDHLLGKLARKGKPTLLMLDEVQELAADSHNRPLVAALRTSLDKRRDGLAVVFTGSNRDALAAMFSEKSAPFFHFATSIALEPLGPPFVDHLLGAFERATGAALDKTHAHAAFTALGGNPFFFRMLLERLLPVTERDMPAALARMRETLAVDLGYDRLWLSLTATQRALAVTLAQETPTPFGEANRIRIGQLARTDPPSIAQTQTALRRLARLGVVSRAEGRSTWTFDDPELARWIASRTADQL